MAEHPSKNSVVMFRPAWADDYPNLLSLKKSSFSSFIFDGIQNNDFNWSDGKYQKATYPLSIVLKTDISHETIQ